LLYGCRLALCPIDVASVPHGQNHDDILVHITLQDDPIVANPETPFVDSANKFPHVSNTRLNIPIEGVEYPPAAVQFW
jgi:hypothetical protein